MKKTDRKPLKLTTQTLRPMTDTQLADVAAGRDSTISTRPSPSTAPGG